MEDLVFTPVQLVSILGMAQALYALVYMAFRSGRLSRAGLAILYFFVLFCGFFYDLAMPFFEEVWQSPFDISWLFWFFLPSLSYLLVLQIAKIKDTPAFWHYSILLLPVIALYVDVHVFPEQNLLYLAGLFSGTMSLLMIWLNKSALDGIWRDGKDGRPRYWLVICLISVNVAFLATVLLLVLDKINLLEWRLLRDVLGVGFVYLASTSLFRIYPQAVLIKERRSLEPHNLKNRKVIDGIKRLMDVERVYQEPQYSRKDFAKELGISEALVSKLINEQYQETVPQLLNRYRVEEAKDLLIETKVSVQLVSEEVGFNSLTTFNRVFKEVVGCTPSHFRLGNR